MGVVAPIKDYHALEQMKKYLRERSLRNYLLFRIGVNLGLSVQELLQLKIEDILNRDSFSNGKYYIRISESLQRDIQHYVASRTSGYMFISAQGNPLSRFQLYGILKNVAESIGYDQPVGAITLRKTFAYWAYRNQLIYLPLLSKYLNHHTVQHTLQYIDIAEEEESNVCLMAVDL
jgi:Site-specific recombinase XerD